MCVWVRQKGREIAIWWQFAAIAQWHQSVKLINGKGSASNAILTMYHFIKCVVASMSYHWIQSNHSFWKKFVSHDSHEAFIFIHFHWHSVVFHQQLAFFFHSAFFIFSHIFQVFSCFHVFFKFLSFFSSMNYQARSMKLNQSFFYCE